MIKIVFSIVVIFASMGFAAPKEIENMITIPRGTLLTFNKDFILPANVPRATVGKVEVPPKDEQFPGINWCDFSNNGLVSYPDTRVIAAGRTFNVVEVRENASSGQTSYIIYFENMNEGKGGIYLYCNSGWGIKTWIDIKTFTEILNQSDISITYPKPIPF